MTITISSDLEEALVRQAKALRTTPEQLALSTLRDQFGEPANHARPVTPEEKIAHLRHLAIDCGVSLADDAVSSDGLYD